MTFTQPAPSIAATEVSSQAIQAEQLRLIFATQHLNLLASFAITAVAAVVLLPFTDPIRIVSWCVVMLFSGAVRLGVLLGWRRDAQRDGNSRAWRNYLLISSALGGIGWGLGNLLLFPGQAAEQQMLLVFITAGISAAAAISLASDPLVAWSFLLPCVLPMELQVFLLPGRVGVGLGVLGLVYVVFLLAVIRRLYGYVKESVTLRLAGREREKTQTAFARALHSSQKKLQALFELSPLGCVLITTDGRLLDANRAFQRMLGREGDTFKQTATISAPECLDESRRRWLALIENGGSDTFETQFLHRDGHSIPVAVHRMLIDAGDGQHYVWSIVEDITERKRHEEQLLALNTRLSLATQAGGIGVWDLDVVEQSLMWDERMYAIFGLDARTHPISSELAAAAIHPDDWSDVTSSMTAAIGDPACERYVQEYRVLLRDDNERWLRTAGLVQRDAGGRALRVIGVAWDITELKRVARLKSEFVSSVSHELRTPLTSIRGSLGLLANGVAGELTDTAKELIDVATKNSERLSLLINDLLDIEKIESGKMRFNVQPEITAALIEQAVAANQGYAQHLQVHLRAEIKTAAAVVVDANRFMQIMANLISNAVKFSRAGDCVDIVALETETPARVRIEVRDCGPGVPMEFRERIFQRFSQADSSDTRARGGSGLGLAITRTLVEKMHGEIGFADRDGGGAVFFVELPRA